MLEFAHYIRFYGEPKINKPKELKGVKQSFSIEYIKNKCTCPVYINNNDVWIHHKDYFSQIFIPPNIKDCGLPLNETLKKYFPNSKVPSNKFVYTDNWGSVVLRNEAWILLKGLICEIQKRTPIWVIKNNILRLQEKACKFEEYELECSDMERFWERVIVKLMKT